MCRRIRSRRTVVPDWLALVSLALAAPAVAATAYLSVLCLIACLPKRQRTAAPTGQTLRFAVVIPAHNEESGLPATLAGCRILNYPTAAVRIFVIADNCTD